MLEEASEGRDACPRADHDDRRCDVLRKPEGAPSPEVDRHTDSHTLLSRQQRLHLPLQPACITIKAI